jgi:hypothetical protein
MIPFNRNGQCGINMPFVCDFMQCWLFSGALRKVLRDEPVKGAVPNGYDRQIATDDEGRPDVLLARYSADGDY